MITIIVNNVPCVIQAYDKGSFVNLCPIQEKPKFEEEIGMTTVYFDRQPPFFTSSRENEGWKTFIAGIDIWELKKELENIVVINITGKDLKADKQYQFTSSQNPDSTDVAEIFYSTYLGLFCIYFNAKLETFKTYQGLKGRMNGLRREYKLDITKEKWQGEKSLTDNIIFYERYLNNLKGTVLEGTGTHTRIENQIKELKTKYYE